MGAPPPCRSPPPRMSALSTVVKVTFAGLPDAKVLMPDTCQLSRVARMTAIVDHAAHLGQHPRVVEDEHVRRIEGGQAVAPLLRILVERDGTCVVRREVTRPRQRVRGTELDAVAEVPVGLHLQRVVVRMARVFEHVEITPAAIRPEEIVRQRISGTRRVGVGRVEARAERNRIDVALLEEIDVHAIRRRPRRAPCSSRIAC